MLDIADYVTLVFDCDGVVLDSNKVKTEAFRAAALPYGDAAASALVAHHVAHGGVSRYAKFTHFLGHIVPEHSHGQNGPDNNALLAAYAKSVRTGLLACDIAPGLATLRAQTPHARWLIVSGGDQAELRGMFVERGIADLFNGGIFGSPDTKDTILAREIAAGTIAQPALFLGDSRYDHQAATQAGLEFLFVSNWSEVPDWQSFVSCEKIAHVERIGTLVSGASE
jgi:phosphoglycolate phosphatase-like HAD superfamily hydrolase